MTAVLVAGCSVLGLVVGWFLDPVITRVPRKQPVFGPPAADEPPPSASRRILVTVLTGALFGATAARFDDSWLLPAYLVLTGALVALAVIDFETYLLPNRIVYPLTVVMLALLALGALADGDLDDYVRGLVAGVIAFVRLLRAPPGLTAQHGLRRRRSCRSSSGSRSACSAGARWCSACSSASSTAR